MLLTKERGGFPRQETGRSEQFPSSTLPASNRGCRIEVAVKQILSGMEVKANASVANPEALDWFRQWAGRDVAVAA